MVSAAVWSGVDFYNIFSYFEMDCSYKKSWWISSYFIWTVF
jgi:hypothetical protein